MCIPELPYTGSGNSKGSSKAIKQKRRVILVNTVYSFTSWQLLCNIMMVFAIHQHVSFRISVPCFVFYSPPGVELLGYMVVLFFSFFEKPLYCFSLWLHQFIFPPTAYTGSVFFHILANICSLFCWCVCVMAILISVRWHLSVVPLVFQFLISHLRFLKPFSQFSFSDFLCLGFLQSFSSFLAPFSSLIF